MGTGPRRLDAHQAAKITALSLDRYRAAGRPFVLCIQRYHMDPVTAEEWDDLLVEWKNDPREGVTKARFEQTVASVEFFFPRFKGQLAWARAVLSGWGGTSDKAHSAAPSSCSLFGRSACCIPVKVVRCVVVVVRSDAASGLRVLPGLAVCVHTMCV